MPPYHKPKPRFIPNKKVKDMNLDEFLDFLDTRREYGPIRKGDFSRDNHEIQGPEGFRNHARLAPNQGVASDAVFQRWKSGSNNIEEAYGDVEYLKSRYMVVL